MNDIFTLNFDNYDNSLSNKNEIIETNEKSIEFCLKLSEKEAVMLIENEKESLNNNERIMFGKSPTVKLIEKFMESSYITQDTYSETIAELTDVFYEVCEESEDLLTDEEIINIMYYFFEQKCGGSIELLEGTYLEEICRNIRNFNSGISEF